MFSGIRTHELYRVTIELSLKSIVLKLVARKACVACFSRTHFYYFKASVRESVIESIWNAMAHGDAREEKWRGNKKMEWVTSKRHMTAEHRLARAVQTLQADVHSSPATSRLNWSPRDLNGLVRCAERRSLVSARVSSHFRRILPNMCTMPA